MGKSYISLTPTLLRPPPTWLRRFGSLCLVVGPLDRLARSIALDSVASFATVLAARRRYMLELVRSPCSLLAALRLPIIYTRSPKKSFQNSVIYGPDFGLKQAFLAVFITL